MKATRAHAAKVKLSIFLPFLFGAVMLTLSRSLTPWFLVGYAVLGIGIGRVAYGKQVQPLVGDAILACTGWLYALMAMFLCWFPPHNNKTLAQMMR